MNIKSSISVGKTESSADIHSALSNKDREAFCYGVFGKRRSGKSTTVEEIARAWRESNPDDVIVAHDPQRRFTEVADFVIKPSDDKWAYKCQQFTNALIIIDELRMLHPKRIMSTDFMDLMYMGAEQSIDVIYIIHSPGLILEPLIYYTTNYIIFATQSREGTFKGKLPNWDLCFSASQIVNKYVKHYGKGKHPLDSNFDGQGFPHMVVDNETEEMSAINMDKDKFDAII